MDGKTRRLSRIFNSDGRTIIVPVDDSLIFGPFNGLHNMKDKLKNIIDGQPDAILAHQGIFNNDIEINSIGRIMNVSASTVNSKHTKKVIVSSVEQSIRMDADCIAVHINVTSKYEAQMLSDLGRIIAEAERYGIPVLVIAYPRKENQDGLDDNYDDLKKCHIEDYTRILCHCVRIAKDMGASIIKTQYSGDGESFGKVVESASPIPIVIAGGQYQEAQKMLVIAEDAIKCGCKGISYGRNIFSRIDSQKMIQALHDIVHRNQTAKVVYSKYMPLDEREGLYENLEQRF